MELTEFKKMLKKAIEDFPEKGKLGFVGIFGSKNLLRDIDVIIINKAGVKRGETLKTIHSLLKQLREKMSERLIVATHYKFIDEVKYLSKFSPGKDILLHLLCFRDLLKGDSKVMNNILETAETLYGKKETIQELTETDKDYYYDLLVDTNCLLSHYPAELVKKKISEKAKYIHKYHDIEIILQGKTSEQIYCETCDLLDGVAKEV